MGKNGFSEEVKNWDASKRIETAKSVTRALTDKVLEVIDLHEANKIIQYSDELTSQIPRSYAARAFSVFQHAMFSFEVIKCIALWDRAQGNAISIPTVVELIDDEEVLAALFEETRSAHMAFEPRLYDARNDPDIQAVIDESLARSQREFAERQASEAAQGLRDAVAKSRNTIRHEQTSSIKNLRNHLAHSLTHTRKEQRTTVPVPNVKYGDEKHLLDVSIEVIEDLFLWVKGTSFDIRGDCIDQAKFRAEELWLTRKFAIASK